jgi:hypothetical protein
MPNELKKTEHPWHQPAYVDFLTGQYSMKELHNKYGASIKGISNYITKRLKENEPK